MFKTTIAKESVFDKTNEVPTVQKLIKILKLKKCIIVSDALNCQKDTIIKQEADYILSVKGNHPNLKKKIADFIQDNELRKYMDKTTTIEKSRERIEKCTDFVCNDIEWLNDNILKAIK